MKLMLKAVIAAAAVVGLVVVMALTCPDEDNFKQWAKDNLTPESGSLVEQAKGAALTVQANWTADYRSHVPWATVDAYQGGTEHRYIGVLGMWMDLQ